MHVWLAVVRCTFVILWGYFSSLDSYEGGECLSDQARRDSICSNGHTPTNLGLPEFPPAISQEGIYHQKVLLAVERWFSFFGWPGGPHPISVPHTLRRYAQEISFRYVQFRLVYIKRLHIIFVSSLPLDWYQKDLLIIPVDSVRELLWTETAGVYMSGGFTVHTLWKMKLVSSLWCRVVQR